MLCVICIERIYCSKRLIYICFVAPLCYCVHLCFHLVSSDWKLEEGSMDRVSMSNKPFYLKCLLWHWQKFELVFLSCIPMTSVKLTNIWAFISVINFFCDISSWNHQMSVLFGIVLRPDLLLLISSCQTSVNFCIGSRPPALFCLRNPLKISENHDTASVNREQRLCRKPKIYLTLGLWFLSGSAFICFCFFFVLFFTRAYCTWCNISASE